MPRPILIATSLICLACLGGIAMAARDFALNAGHAADTAWQVAAGVFAGLLGLAVLLLVLAKRRSAAQPSGGGHGDGSASGNRDRSSQESRQS